MRERAGRNPLDLKGEFPKLWEWESGAVQPTLRQLEGCAGAVHVPVGYLFLPAPPEETLPIPDFRTLGDRDIARPSSNLLDTQYLQQQRQKWFRNYARMHGLERLVFVGGSRLEDEPFDLAGRIREALGLSIAERQQLPTWTDGLRQLFAKAEEGGLLVIISSIVGSNSYRKLNVEAGRAPDQPVERWCNMVAAEVLMPLEQLRASYAPGTLVLEGIQRLARLFKVSTLVALRRLFDGGMIDQPTLWECFRQEVARIRALNRGAAGGGDFYRTLGARTGKRFARAVLSSTLEGQSLFEDAFSILGMRKTSTFYEAARSMGSCCELSA